MKFKILVLTSPGTNTGSVQMHSFQLLAGKQQTCLLRQYNTHRLCTKTNQKAEIKAI